MYYLLDVLSYLPKAKKILVNINNNYINQKFISTKYFFLIAEDFQIDELAIHSGDWNENVYTADCSVLDGVCFI
jgi:hypothetical protein